ncbi:hypothetical protein niasHT_007101 [Heterodera trifolii]|uniref:BTB domain-containing protein n=1 Tax=Heterodera trifolii TaxID=157864 RepID=A0ABD2LXL6_9BILA
MFPSPRPPIGLSPSWTERFFLEREALQRELAKQIRHNMANIIGHAPTADVLLVASDGHKFHAHSLILRKRAPNFFRRYVQSVAPEARIPNEIVALCPRHQLFEIAIGDVDSNTLGFFIRSIYTAEEVLELSNGQRHRTGNGMDEDEDDGEKEDQFESGEGNLLEGSEQSDQQKESLIIRMGDRTENKTNQRDLAIPMTSFLELAEYAEQKTKSEGTETIQQRNVPSSSISDFGTVSADRILSPKFIPITSANEEQQMEKEMKEEKKIFPIFIGMDGTVEEEPNGTDSVPSMCSSIMAKSLPSAADASESLTLMDSAVSSIRGRAIARRRLSSVSSLNSLCSVDLLTPTYENAPFTSVVDESQKTASKLATDLLQIYTEQRDAEEQKCQLGQIVLVEAKDGTKLRAPLCTVWANSEYFRAILSPLLGPPLKSLLLVPLPRFSSPSVHFFLQFLHGGLCSIPPSTSDENPLDVWELFELGAFVRSEMFVKMLALNVRAMLFHFFHRPCVACVSALFDALPKMELEIPALRELFDEALRWQAANFTRIWKGRVFLHLSDRWQRHCRDALLQSVDEENFVDVLLGCEKLQVILPRLKSAAAAQRVLRMLADVEEYCLELIRAQFDSLISSRAFRTLGKGLALNLSLLEDILPPLVHSLSADTAIRAFIALKELLAELDQNPSAESRTSEFEMRPPSSVSSCDNSPMKKLSKQNAYFGSSGSIASGFRAQQIMASEWNPRFKGLCHRLGNVLDRHMLHFASSMLDSEEWGSLGHAEQARIREFGLFVELKMPRAPLPRLSSFGRVHKRSSSVGVGPNSRLGMAEMDRTRSLERKALHGHATVTSRPSLSTQMEEEIAGTTNMIINGQDGRDEEKKETNWKEEDGGERRRGMNERDEDDGRRRRSGINEKEEDDGGRRRGMNSREEEEEDGRGKGGGMNSMEEEEEDGRGRKDGMNSREEDDGGGRNVINEREEEGEDGRGRGGRRGMNSREEEEEDVRERRRGMNNMEEDDGRRARHVDKAQKVRKRSAETVLDLEQRTDAEKANNSLTSIQDEAENGLMPSSADVKSQSAHLNAKIMHKSANVLVQKTFSNKNLETEQTESRVNKKSKNEQKQRKTDERQKEKAEGKSEETEKEKAIENEKKEKPKRTDQTTLLEAMPSSSNTPQKVPVPLIDRQRTHTVMTVEENVRAGIVAYLGTIGPSNETGSSRSKKPQSIVRPMPQQQREDGVPSSSTAQQKKRTSRTTTTKRMNTNASQIQIPSQTGTAKPQQETADVGWEVKRNRSPN